MPVSRRTAEKPYWQSDCGRATIYVGDCRQVMTSFKPDQFHAIVTDPPYGLEFMQKEWDAPWKADGSVDARQQRTDELDDPVKAKYIRHQTTYGLSNPKLFQEWFKDRASAMLRVAKPGAHLLSFGGTRMYHRMTCAIEDAGFEIRDCVMWVYGTGFPKGTDVSKSIDKLCGVSRRVTGKVKTGKDTRSGFQNLERIADMDERIRTNLRRDEPVTPEAIKWNGWNSSLKPAFEPIILARKETNGSIAQNLIKHECGALNVDGCRVGTTGTTIERHVQTKVSSGSGVYEFNNQPAGSESMNGDFVKDQKDGRWPANLIHDGSDEVVSLLPEEAARFFYTAKAGDSDRPHGREGSVHPTVKPLDLMCYLVRLVCASDKIVLDPFMGSGSTLCAAVKEGMQCVGIEQDVKYADIAIGRLRLALDDRARLHR